MFCHKCGAQLVEGAAFCPKCGTKAVHTDDDQQPMNTATPIVELQQADAEVPPIAENTKRTPKASDGLAFRKILCKRDSTKSSIEL